jgi:GR25 family glycosyltransferase involved in LPS biosynthesis
VKTNNRERQFDFYVITLRHENRMKNVEKQQYLIHENIQIFDAVKGDQLNMYELMKSDKYKQNILLNDSEIIKKREIGCYLSHYQVYEKIQQLNKPGYTIIFEDDFSIKSNNLMHEIDKILNKVDVLNIDFDILFLGNLQDNHGVNIIDNLYFIDKNVPLWGTHAYMINNKNIDKILKKTYFIARPIDQELGFLSKNREINTIMVYPNLVVQTYDGLQSTINDVNIKN